MSEKYSERLIALNEILVDKGETALSEKDAQDLITGDETDKELVEIASDYLNDIHTERCEARREREEYDGEDELFYKNQI